MDANGSADKILMTVNGREWRH